MILLATERSVKLILGEPQNIFYSLSLSLSLFLSLSLSSKFPATYSYKYTTYKGIRILRSYLYQLFVSNEIICL